MPGQSRARGIPCFAVFSPTPVPGAPALRQSELRRDPQFREFPFQRFPRPREPPLAHRSYGPGRGSERPRVKQAVERKLSLPLELKKPLYGTRRPAAPRCRRRRQACAETWSCAKKRRRQKEPSMSDLGTAEVQAELQAYLNSKNINTLFIQIVESLLIEKPDNPIGFIVEYLRNRYPEQVRRTCRAATPAGGSSTLLALAAHFRWESPSRRRKPATFSWAKTTRMTTKTTRTRTTRTTRTTTCRRWRNSQPDHTLGAGAGEREDELALQTLC
eukprot:scaffold1505_cov256-Pinguiococcus_pyrenoidosus.AAC.19